MVFEDDPDTDQLLLFEDQEAIDTELFVDDQWMIMIRRRSSRFLYQIGPKLLDSMNVQSRARVQRVYGGEGKSECTQGHEKSQSTVALCMGET
jgi:hypothetical protein